MINSNTKYDSVFQNQFIITLHKFDHEFKDKRYWGIKSILANLTFFILGVGVGYVAAGLYNYKKNNHFFFFNQTTTQELVEDISKPLTPPASAA